MKGHSPARGLTLVAMGITFLTRRKLTTYQSNILIDGLAYGERMANMIPATTSAGDPNPAYTAQVERVAKGYDARIVSILAAINSRKAGRAVLRAIAREPCVLLIRPWFRSSPTSPNARAIADDVSAATAKGRLLRNGDGEVEEPRSRGTGAGSDETIEFLPQDFVNMNATKELQDFSTGNIEDEALLHEMVHSMRSMAGVKLRRKVPDQPLYDDMEEFFAIVIANIYRSECGRKGLRAQHRNYTMALFESGAFLKVERNRAHLRLLRRQQPQLFSDLHAIDVKFNPIRLMWD